jgi:hypothetical protein
MSTLYFKLLYEISIIILYYSIFTYQYNSLASGVIGTFEVMISPKRIIIIIIIKTF